MERKKEKQEAHVEIETEHPGYLVAQDTYYIGTIKGVGRIYQQTVIDTYSRVTFAKLYTSKHAITSANVLNDRGTEFNGRPENHEYKLYLQLENIDHSKTKVRHPQSNGTCERLHRIFQQYLINLDHIKKYVRGEGNYLIMSNNQSIPFARNQKDKLIEKFGWL